MAGDIAMEAWEDNDLGMEDVGKTTGAGHEDEVEDELDRPDARSGVVALWLTCGRGLAWRLDEVVDGGS